MDKRKLATIIGHKTGFGRNDIERVIESTFETIAEVILDGGRVPIRGFGTFRLKQYPAQTFCRRNGEKFVKPPRSLPSYLPTEALKDRALGQTGKKRDRRAAPGESPGPDASPGPDG